MRIFAFIAAVASLLAAPCLAQTAVISTPRPVTATATSGTVAVAGTYQSVLAANPTRRGCLIQNRAASAVLRVFVGAPGSATDATAIELAAGATFNCSQGNVVVTNEISVTSPTVSSPYVVLSE